jgi:hypothetical protein
LEFSLKDSKACELVESPQHLITKKKQLITVKEETLTYFLVVKIVTYPIKNFGCWDVSLL